MYYYEITKTWGVQAMSEDDGVQIISASPKAHLKKETVTRTEYIKPKPKTGWAVTIKNQLVGTNSKR
jgi:hypothetical protein